MALLPLYFDIATKSLVAGVDDPTAFTIPVLRQEETPTFDITMLRRIKQVKPFYEKVSFGGWTAMVAIGTAGTVLSSGTSGTLSTDNYTFQDISLPLNVAAISALSTDPATLSLELRFTETSSGNYFGKKFSVQVEKGVALAGTLATPEVDRALTVSEAQLGYVTYKLPAGRGIEFTSEDGTKTAVLYLGNDGTLYGPGPAL